SEVIDTISQEICNAVRALDATYALRERALFRSDFSQSIFNLVKQGYIGQEKFIIRQSDYIVKELSLLQNAPHNDEGYVKELLTEANIYSDLT
ncbi:hypothetical protein, partial [Escherichia coli]